jgi:hypothetical protein
MQIVIPSRKRSDTIGRRSLPLFPTAVVTVDEAEMDAYRPVCQQAGVTLLPHPPMDTLAKIYNWCVDAFAADVVILADDDIVKLVSFTGISVKAYRDPIVIYQVLENAAECARGVGARLFGFTDSQNPMHYKPQDPLSFVANLYTVCGYVGKKVHSDPYRRMFRDMDTTLTELMDNRIVFCDTRFHFESVSPLRQGGGNAVVRAGEDLPTAMSYMQRKWGPYVRKGKTGDLVLNLHEVKRRQAKGTR